MQVLIIITHNIGTGSKYEAMEINILQLSEAGFWKRNVRRQRYVKTEPGESEEDKKTPWKAR